jgi:hypothetical protein
MDRQDRQELRERARMACEIAQVVRAEARALVARCMEDRLTVLDDGRQKGRPSATLRNLHALERT